MIIVHLAGQTRSPRTFGQTTVTFVPSYKTTGAKKSVASVERETTRRFAATRAEEILVSSPSRWRRRSHNVSTRSSITLKYVKLKLQIPKRSHDDERDSSEWFLH